jgi:hypothetical protein
MWKLHHISMRAQLGFRVLVHKWMDNNHKYASMQSFGNYEIVRGPN